MIISLSWYRVSNPINIATIKKFLYKFLKIIGIAVAVIFLLLVALILFIRSPWGQGIIVDKATHFVSDKTGTVVQIDRLFVTFTGNLFLEGLYLEDTKGDTLIYSDKLEAGVSILPLIQNGHINVTKLEWEGLKAQVSREEDSEDFNFNFLVEAFIPQEEEEVIEEGQTADTTATEPLSISLSPIRLKNFDLVFDDRFGGIDASLQLGSLDVVIPTLDLETFDFHIREVTLENTQVAYRQTKPFEPAEDSGEESLLPRLRLDELTLRNVQATYDNEVDGQEAKLDITDFIVQIPEANLRDQLVTVDLISLKESSVLFYDFSAPSAEDVNPEPSESTPFSWPDWKVELHKLVLLDNQVEFKTSDRESTPGHFNPEVIVLDNLNFELADLVFRDEKVSLDLKQLQFLEGSGFELKAFNFTLGLDNTSVSIDNFTLATNRSKLNAELALGFESIQGLMDFPDRSTFDLDITDLVADVRDSYYFEPSLAQDTLIRELAKAPFSATLTATGSLASMHIPRLDLNWGKTVFKANGRVQNAMEVDRLSFDFPKATLVTDKQTLLRFVDEKQLGVQLPEEVRLEASAKGMLDDLNAVVELDTDRGNLLLDGTFTNNQQLAFDADLKVNALQLGYLLAMPELDTLTFAIHTSGSGSGLEDLDAELTSSFERLRLYGNDYSGLGLEGKLESGAGDIHLWLEDEFLDFDLLTKLDLDSINSKIELNLDLKGADFYELGYAAQSTRAKFLFNAKFQGNPENFNLETAMRDGVIVYDGRSYPIGSFDVQAAISEDSTSVDIESLLLNGHLRSNSSPDELITALGGHFRQHLNEIDSLRAPTGDIIMNLDMAISQAPILNQVLLQGLEQLDSAKIKVDFNQIEDRLVASVDFPYVNYSGTEIDSLGIRINSDNSDLNLAFGFLGLTSGPLLMDRTYFTGELENRRLYFDFNSFDGEEKLVHVASDIGYRGDTLSIHVSPEGLLVNKREWDIPENNLIQIADRYVHFEDFRFFRNQQELSILDDIEGVEEEHLAVQFKDFRLETFTSLLNPDELIASGFMDGRLIVENPFGATGLLSNLKIDSLNVLQVPLGNLTLDASSKNLGDYLIAMALKDGGMDLDLNGQFLADEAGGNFDLKLDLNKIDMDVIAGLSAGELRDASGFISGVIEASGTTTEPQYKGGFKFNEASFVPTQLNTKYLLSNETIDVDNAGVYLNNFTIRDAENNTFTIDGSVLTESYINPSFDLSLIAKNFTVVSSSRDDNDLFFGNGIIDANVTITGDLTLPKVVARLNVKEGTNLTVIIPESQLDLVERDGTVIFVNRQDPEDILTRSTEETTSSFVGYDIRAVLQVNPAATFKIVVDERSGDNLSIAGRADLNLEINPNGRMTLSGNYEISKGHYEMSLYSLVSRRFDIAEGSRITWNGDPMDANLAISAIYEVRTASSELMATQLSGANTDSRNQYQQELPFMVYLNVNGELLRPEISFRLDMPEEQRGALGGNVYSRVLQVNEQEDELNKQVFSLLVLNRFFPSSGSDGAGGGTSAIARSSVSQVLSGQLNALSSNLLGNSGLELDFDLDSFTDYQGNSPQERTQLNVSARKRLFNDRLVVQVGSQMDIEGSSHNQDQANALLGNISLEYLLTENGRYRVRAFRKNQFESIVDGQLIVTGFGLIFNREFNRFLELWRGLETDATSINPIEELQREKQEKEEEEESGKKAKRKEENEE